MLPSLVMPSAHRLLGAGAVPRHGWTPALRVRRGLGLVVQPGLHGSCSRHILTAPSRPLSLNTQAGPSPGDRPRVESKIIDCGSYMDLRHGMDSH
jgi:hypothetical protein